MVGNLRDIIANRKVVICVGPGGVGKTTTAAALALGGALLGRKSLVITIDPARRLANSLGFAELGHEERPVPADRLRAAGLNGDAKLYAMMLDQKRVFDEVLARYANDATQRARLLENRIYQQIASTLTGAHEYAALAKLYEMTQERDYDLVVVDTPPTAHALDFLDAPGKVVGALDSPAVDWLVKPFKSSGRFSLKLVTRGGAYVLKRVGRFVGSEFLDEMARFFVDAAEVLAGFRQRAAQVVDLLRQPSSAFVLVATPEPFSVGEALRFHERLQSTHFPFAGVVVNRVHARATPPPDASTLSTTLRARLGCDAAACDEIARAFRQSYDDIEVLARADEIEIAALRTHLATDARLLTVAAEDEDIFDIPALLRVGRQMWDQGTS